MGQSKPSQEVKLVEHNSRWATIFSEEADRIKTCLGSNCLDVQHIGSTSVPQLIAKPIIDILVVVNELTVIDSNPNMLNTLSYTAKGEYGIPGRRFFWKTPEKRRFNLHLFEKGHPEISRLLAFRHYLREHPDVARGYGAIKLALAKQFLNNPMDYQDAKASFIRAIDYRNGHAQQDQLQAKDNLVLTPYNPLWPKLAEAEIDAIINTINLPYQSIHHVGSTAIPDLIAKPIIDLFIGVESMQSADDWIKPLQNLGYIDWPENPDKNHARYFKGMPPYGLARTHHVHIIKVGNDLEQRILFRDKLRQSEPLKQDYAALKTKLIHKNPNDRERYTDEKAAFIQQVLDDG